MLYILIRFSTITCYLLSFTYTMFPSIAVNGNWAGWSSWGSCSVTCGTGSKVRTRTCTNPAPQYNGANCAGSGSDTSSCSLPNCPSR